MKTRRHLITRSAGEKGKYSRTLDLRPVLLACSLALPPLPALAGKLHAAASQDVDPATSSSSSATSEPGPAPASDEVTIEARHEKGTSNMPWLGVSTKEASETLASQLDLEPGVGLVITYVAPESPAAGSGLRKNDVIVQFDNQSLVHPAQLRKLVRVRKEGEIVKLAYYRGGKRQNLSVTLGSTKSEPSVWDDEERALKGNLKDLNTRLKDLHLDDTVKDQMRILTESLGNIKIDQKEIQEDIRQGMEQARKAIQEALRNVTNSDPVRKLMENLSHSPVIVGDKADVMVRSSSKNTKSMVKSDDSGTIVLVGDPKLHLTAHDKKGKLLFDGPIESADERAKVPQDLWERVEPLVKQMEPAAEEPETNDSK